MSNKKYLFLVIISFLFFNSCSNLQKGIGTEKDVPNEFLIEKRDPLVLPPDYNILPPDSKENKKETKKTDFSIEEILNKDLKNKNFSNSSSKNNSSNIEEEILKQIKLMNTRINLDFFFNRAIGIDFTKNKIYKNNLKKCSKAAEKLIFEIENKSNEIFNSFNFDYQKNIKFVRDKIKKKKNLLVVGMGGSSAGSKAISSYLRKNIFYLDNYDQHFINNFFQNHNLKKFTIFVISKSGKTFETLAILNLIYQFLSKNMTEQQIKKNIIVIVEDTDNPLNNFAKKNNIQRISHNKNIGGRYSIFSETSMLLFNFSPKVIVKSTKKVISKLFNKNLNDQSSPIVNAAIILTLQKIYNLKFNVNVLYDYSFKNFSYWFHQLFSESLGKNNNAVTPLTSICPKDHHSMMQLFLGGPNDKLFNIYPPSTSNIFKKFDNLNFGSIENKTPDSLLVAQFEGLIKSFQQKKIPYRIIRSSRSPKNKLSNILELFAYNIVETIILGYAQNINPYDQPDVEQVKLNTFNFSKNNN